MEEGNKEELFFSCFLLPNLKTLKKTSETKINRGSPAHNTNNKEAKKKTGKGESWSGHGFTQ